MSELWEERKRAADLQGTKDEYVARLRACYGSNSRPAYAEDRGAFSELIAARGAHVVSLLEGGSSFCSEGGEAKYLRRAEVNELGWRRCADGAGHERGAGGADGDCGGLRNSRGL